MSADIDIDFASRSQILDLIKTTPARQENNNQVTKHNSGVYPTAVPLDPFNDCASIDYREAESRGYFKIDFLNVNLYQMVRDPEHYQTMLDKPVDWNLILRREFCEQVIHIGNRYNLVADMRPDTIERMAAFIAIIRPGKAHLQRQPWDAVFSTVWDGDDSRGFVFKKSHSISYARLVALHINLLAETL